MFPVVHLALPGFHVIVALHAVFALVAVVAATLLAVRRARAPGATLAAAPFVAAAGLLGARLLFRGVHGSSAFAWTGGLSSMGGIAGGLVTVVVAARLMRVSATDLLDAFAPASVLALAIGRIGCFLGGCCLGRPTRLPWGIVFPELDATPRHPLPLYEAGIDLVLLAWLLRLGGPPGTVARHACVGLGVVRLVLESLRDPAATDPIAAGWLTVARVGAALLVVGGLLAGRMPAPRGLRGPAPA